jgi:hypothetical protein
MPCCNGVTYARPSVYYEAGFAEREIPVIYTVRRDHLALRVDDEFGVFRVHFDLLMKNLIDWTDPSDQTFVARLARRVDEILGPIRDRLAIDAEDSTPPTNRSQVRFIQEQPQYNVNFGDVLKNLRQLREHYIVCSFLPISFHHICEMLPDYRADDDRRILTAETTQELPWLQWERPGEVYLGEYGTNFFGGIGKTGTCVENVPADVPSTKPHIGSGYRPWAPAASGGSAAVVLCRRPPA